MLAQWDDLTLGEDVPDRGRRLASRRRVDRRPVRAAAGSRVLRDLRRDREHHVELADAARHRRSALRRPARANALQRLHVRPLARRQDVLLREPTAIARRPRPARVGSGCLLPAEHHADCSHRCTTTSRRRPTTASRFTSTRRRRSGRATSSSASTPRIRGMGRSSSRWSRAPDTSGRSRYGFRRWARGATLDGEEVAAGGYAEVRRRWRAGANGRAATSTSHLD